MKKTAMAIIFACFAMTLAAQDDGIRVDFKGDKPSISDFAWTYLSVAALDDEGCIDEATNSVKQAWIRHRDGLPQEEGVTLTVDQKNGYVCYESRQDDYLSRAEMCYWNEADGKHKLFAYSMWSYTDGKPAMGQYDCILFFRYDNATRKMTRCDGVGFEVEYYNTAYSLPRTGKDIIVTKVGDDGKIRKETLKWNGHGFRK